MQTFLTSIRAMSVVTLSLLTSVACYAQLVSTDPDWKEAEVPPPPAFNAATLTRLVTFVVSVDSELRWAVDPASIKISEDSLIRYVVFARSTSGTVSAFYESINCGKAEFKTYARYNTHSGWLAVENPEWRSLRDKLPSKHALMLAKQGACVGNAAVNSADELVRALKNPQP